MLSCDGIGRHRAGGNISKYKVRAPECFSMAPIVRYRYG